MGGVGLNVQLSLSVHLDYYCQTLDEDSKYNSLIETGPERSIEFGIGTWNLLKVKQVGWGDKIRIASE